MEYVTEFIVQLVRAAGIYVDANIITLERAADGAFVLPARVA